MLNLLNGFWYELDSMPVAKETKGILFGDTFFLVGGHTSHPLKDIESFNLVSGKWKAEGSLFREVERPGVAVHDGVIYVYEGKSFQVYNPNKRELKEFSINLGLKSCEMFAVDNALYIIGGYEEVEGDKIPSSCIYKIEIKEFNSTKILREVTF